MMQADLVILSLDAARQDIFVEVSQPVGILEGDGLLQGIQQEKRTWKQ